MLKKTKQKQLASWHFWAAQNNHFSILLHLTEPAKNYNIYKNMSTAAIMPFLSAFMCLALQCAGHWPGILKSADWRLHCRPSVHLFRWWDMSMQRYINAAASPPFSLPLLLPCQRQGKWRSKYRCRVHCNSGAPPPFICYDSFCYCWNQMPRREEKASILFNKLPGRVSAEKEALSSALHWPSLAKQQLRRETR